jgi:hypothetical protein
MEPRCGDKSCRQVRFDSKEVKPGWHATPGKPCGAVSHTHYLRARDGCDCGGAATASNRSVFGLLASLRSGIRSEGSGEERRSLATKKVGGDSAFLRRANSCDLSSKLLLNWPSVCPSESMSKITEASRDHISNEDFAFPKERKEPIHDAAHVRNAIARFKQVQRVTDAERDAAWERIKSAAKKHKVELNEQDWRELA